MTEVLKQLQAVRTEMVAIAAGVAELSIEMALHKVEMATLAKCQMRDHEELSAITARLDRIERRLELVDETG